jgi:hypothetical protein
MRTAHVTEGTVVGTSLGSFGKYLLSRCYGLSTVLGTGIVVVNKIHISFFYAAYFLVEG